MSVKGTVVIQLSERDAKCIVKCSVHDVKGQVNCGG